MVLINDANVYNTDITKTGNSVVYAFFSTTQNERNYFWVNNSCIENLGSVFFKPTSSVDGQWLTPKPGRKGGTNEIIRNKYCK